MADDTMVDQSAERRPVGDVEAIRQAAMDYVQGWYEGDVERVRRSLHPELAKRRILSDPHTGEEQVRHVSQQLLVDLTQQGGGSDVPVDKRYYEVSILDVSGEIASVRAESYEYVDYLHLALSRGKWMIVNVLYLLKAAPDGEPA
ncbi:MAG TPA: nuclear transport factor 2 family protein [Ktedonobacterales bacterium]|jgi:predicted lipid-binding transport protein (Tim44 family)